MANLLPCPHPKVVVTELLHLPAEYRRWSLDLFQIDGNRRPDFLWQNLRGIKEGKFRQIGDRGFHSGSCTISIYGEFGL